MVMFIVWIVFIPLEQKKIKSHKNICENKSFCNVIMPSEGTEILQYNLSQKSDKAAFFIYADLEYVIEKIDECKKTILKIHLQQN